MAENIVTGRKYRILTDATNRIWDRISFWTASSDVEMADGSTLEENLGDIKGITSSTTVGEPGYAVDARAFSDLYNALRGNLYTLPAGQTTITIQNSALTSDSIINVYPEVYGAGPIDIQQDPLTNAVTLVFDERTTAMNVRVSIL